MEKVNKTFVYVYKLNHLQTVKVRNFMHSLFKDVTVLMANESYIINTDKLLNEFIVPRQKA